MNEKQYIQTEFSSGSNFLPDTPAEKSYLPEKSMTVMSNNTPDTMSEESVSWFLLLKELLQVVVPAIVLAFLVQFFLAQPTVVYGQSMEPNLSPRQRLVIDKLTYRFTSPQRYDIVVLELPNIDQLLVKRIIGLPGETIKITNGLVYVNNAPIDDDFSDSITLDYPHDLIRLASDEYYVLGDNRSNSNDSRTFGPVLDEFLIGRVWFRYWPLNQLKYF